MVGSLIVAAARITFALRPLQGIGTGTLVRKPLLTADIAPAKAASRVEIKQLDFKPLQTTGGHIHPVPVVGYIS